MRSATRVACALAVVVVLFAVGTSCAATGGAGLALRSLSSSIGDDRVVLRQHTAVLGVAASSRHVFALTTRGLLAYDRVFARWSAPSSQVDEDLALAGVTQLRAAVLAADPIEEAVWIGVPGAVVLYRAQTGQVLRVTVVGQPEVIAFARGDADAYVRASGQWLRISRAGFATPLPGGIGTLALTIPPQLGEVYERHPALRGQLAFLLRDEFSGAIGAASVTAGTLSPDQSGEVWIGTRSDGLWRVDANFLRAEPLRYGVLDEMIGAVAIGEDGVWSGGQAVVRDGGLSFASRELRQFTWLGGGTQPVFDGRRTTALSIRGNVLWTGTDRGVVRVRLGETGDGNRDAGTRDAGIRGVGTRDVGSGTTQWGTLHGLPSERVTALVPRDEGAWVGTTRGLAFIHDTSPSSAGRGEAIAVALAGAPVRALVLSSGTLLIGSTDGVYAMSATPPSAGEVRETVRRLLPSLPAFRRPIDALAWSDSVLLVVTDQRAHLLPLRNVVGATGAIDSASLEGMRTHAAVPDHELAAVGPVVAAAVDGRAVWIAGARGLLAFARDAGVLRVLYAGQTLPENITALALDGEWAWVGTNNGLVRLRRARDGGLP